MVVLVVGTPDSGKSECAERLICELAGDNPKFYIATMEPFGEEGAERVKKHRAMREGRRFETIECTHNITSLIPKLEDIVNPNCLLECMSNLIGNEMYLPENGAKSDTELQDYIVNSVKQLCETARNTVIVTNEFAMEDSFDDETIRYVGMICEINEKLRAFADQVYIMETEETRNK